MTYRLNKSLDNNKTLLVLSALCVLFGFIAFLSFPVGFLFLPLAAAFYGAVIVVERQSRLRYSYILPILLLLVEVLLWGFYSFNSVFAVAIGAVMGYSFSKGKSKAECSVYITLLFALCILLSVFLYLFYITDSFSFSTVFEYVNNGYRELREAFIQSLVEISAENEAGYYVEIITEDTAALVFDTATSLLVSILVMFSFVLSGIALKLFSSSLMKRADDPEYFVKWRFLPTSFIAYAYIVLAVLNFLARGSTDLIALTVANLCYILMPAFVFLGFQFIYALFRQRYTAFMSIVIIAVAAMLFGSVLFDVLSYLGVFFTVLFHKASKKFSV